MSSSNVAGAPHPPGGLSLAPFRGLRPAVDADRLARVLCPPYDVIDAEARRRLLETDPLNAVAIILPDPTPQGYAEAASELDRRLEQGTYATDADAALYVYEMRDRSGHVTRGLLGAVELRDPADGVILPHENTMAGPVADRLEVMTSTGTDLEPIYLVYDGGGAGSALVRSMDTRSPLAEASTEDGVTHRLWAVTDAAEHAAVATDLSGRHALIADGHHRYATYRERQRLRRAADGDGPWDRGLALLVDSSDYGPQVHAIHRVLPGLALDDAITRIGESALLEDVTPNGAGPVEAPADDGADAFTAVLTDGTRAVRVIDTAGRLKQAATRDGEAPALAELDVTVLHRGLVESVWGLADDVETVGYAHSVGEAVDAARRAGGIAVLLRATPVGAVAAVAAEGARMPRKSTLFTPKPASGLVMRRLVDQI